MNYSKTTFVTVNLWICLFLIYLNMPNSKTTFVTVNQGLYLFMIKYSHIQKQPLLLLITVQQLPAQHI